MAVNSSDVQAVQVQSDDDLAEGMNSKTFDKCRNLISNLFVGNEAVNSSDIQPVQVQSDLEEGMN